MSYTSMGREGFECDFPGCNGTFDQTQGAKIGIMKNGEPLTFCQVHSERLVSSGVVLVTLDELRKAQGPTKEELEKQRREQEQLKRETYFINSLK